MHVARSNADVFKSRYNIAATVVKIGSAACLEHFSAPLPEPLRDIDVLFFGMIGPELLGVMVFDNCDNSARERHWRCHKRGMQAT